MEKLLFSDWESLLHIVVCAIIAFLILFIFIRIAGKRTLASLNAFDFVVTVSLGSTLSSMILVEVTLAEGALALLVIIALQFLLAKLAFKSKFLEKIINSDPVLLFYDGKYLEGNLSKELVTKDEILSEVRKYRLYRMEDVKAVVMELNGEITVVKKTDQLSADNSLADVDTEDD